MSCVRLPNLCAGVRIGARVSQDQGLHPTFAGCKGMLLQDLQVNKIATIAVEACQVCRKQSCLRCAWLISVCISNA